MMLGERSYGGTTVHTPPWPSAADDHSSLALSPTAVNANGNVDDYSLFFQADSLKALQRYLPSNSTDVVPEFSFADSDGSDFLPVDAHSCDNFRMFEFKVRKCTRGRSHDWTECPFAHPGEKARRRDPRKYHYSGTACPDFRKGTCRKGDACEFSHGVFECWLHPARYRTQPCKDGVSCKRRVCFFAHAPEQLRVLSPRADSYDGSASSSHSRFPFIASPESPSPPAAESPPMSPTVNEMVASLRQLQLNKVKSMPSSWLGSCPSPRLKVAPPGYFSVPTTPTRAVARPGLGYFEAWDCEEEPMERVESGRNLRAKMFEKLSKENPLERVDPDPDPNPNPDVDWVSELIN
ncbi:zinc finger CCCH domain-containing protein 20-like [Salvia miltiorrhiza]|uniref:zinc finger CCCH domain-containing protein 20-like n=1 Tax=Salvia miltiorrhiza TaxID=226208 RepID=UPI0025AC9283|nr:zinc finger CCCH domain-containing protein 20-like [Salvia miltiorrhiza]XP_057768381.1 zinc finger CCCH domain-containing protein 20-like [Salvia miltiorrhiza]